MKHLHIVLLAALAAIGTGCMSPNTQVIYHDRHSEAGRQIANLDATGRASLDKTFQARARRIAIEFISHAQAGNVKAMMGLTSALTLEHTGRDRVRTVYAQQVVPAFHDVAVSWSPGGKPQEEGGFSGYEVTGTARGRKVSPFYVYVFQERGRFVIGSVAQTPRS